MKIVINGIGIAGPTLAFWLTRAGHEVLLVDEAPHLRTGGYVVDFWGVGYDIIERMGLLPEIRRLGYQMRELRLVGPDGRPRGGFSVSAFERATGDRFTTVARSDISATIYRAIAGKVETLFGDSVAGIDEHPRGVHVTFDHAPARDADLVIGADGLHSRVRRLAFGADRDPITSLGYHVAAFQAEGYRPRDELVYLGYGLPGRQISRFAMRGDRTLFLFILRDEYVRSGAPKEVLRQAFAGAGWEWPAIERELLGTDALYFDTVSQVRVDRWSTGRTALVGDAAACVSLMAGEGTGLAIAEAYVLAGELNRCGGDHRAAFTRYEARLRPLLRQKQAAAKSFASSFAPRTQLGLALRDGVTRLMRIPALATFLAGRALRDEITLPDYDRGGGTD